MFFKTKREKLLEKELSKTYKQLFEMSRELARFKGSTTWSFNSDTQFQEILSNSLYEFLTNKTNMESPGTFI